MRRVPAAHFDAGKRRSGTSGKNDATTEDDTGKENASTGSVGKKTEPNPDAVLKPDQRNKGVEKDSATPETDSPLP